MKLHIEIPDEKQQKAIKEIANEKQWSQTKVGKIAIEFYLKAKRKIQ